MITTMEMINLNPIERAFLTDRVNQGLALIESAQADYNKLVAYAIKLIFDSHNVSPERAPTNIKEIAFEKDQKGVIMSIGWIKEPSEQAAPAANADLPG